MKRILYIIFFVFAASTYASSSLEDADNSYMQGAYEDAVAHYKKALEEGVSASVFFNLGNAYYRLEDLGNAILNYERALVLSPEDEDVLFNLELCKARQTDQFNAPSEMFFVTWSKSFLLGHGIDVWAAWSVFFLVLTVVFYFIYRFASRLGVRKFGFFLFAVSFLLMVFANGAAAYSVFHQDHDIRAVVITTTDLKKTDEAESPVVRPLHTGTIVEVIDQNSRGGLEVIIPNGKKGWVRAIDVVSIMPLTK